MAFNAKNLRYEANEPSFLRKLRSQYGGVDFRHERSQQRPRRPKDDDDDGPTYVYEGTNEYLSMEEYEALVRGEEKKDENAGQEDNLPSESEAKASSEKEADTLDTEEDGPKSQQKLAEIGGQKKRKQAKVVGEENVAENDTVQEDNPSTRKPKQKKKKIKLSFDDAEEN
ncbi:hypothetical protein VTN96DRAFT_4050 [Rasamsonia emersonii]|uniref:DUF4604 domain-containing protein n=1 Tax=Rasamsonia emersonii (strain ATCC 16479 / CBS 393.64 / IMI 116815) TaxID=1408163 RepID=A0A0F4YPY8_RASE3|nr:hypothetical protein T310_6076 [Rasamsonia emersonii CBS 393.64]KKA19916.1 hypothetical protein T310_6076 [Rasamsonia emersonii CBS 393.64]